MSAPLVKPLTLTDLGITPISNNHFEHMNDYSNPVGTTPSGSTEYFESKYSNPQAGIDLFDNPDKVQEDLASRQSTLDQVGNTLAHFTGSLIGTAGSTISDAVVGIPIAAASLIFSGQGFGAAVNEIWHNPVSEGFNTLVDKSQSNFVNYKMNGIADFADQFLNGVGFLAGAVAGSWATMGIGDLGLAASTGKSAEQLIAYQLSKKLGLEGTKDFANVVKQSLQTIGNAQSTGQGFEEINAIIKGSSGMNPFNKALLTKAGQTNYLWNMAGRMTGTLGEAGMEAHQENQSYVSDRINQYKEDHLGLEPSYDLQNQWKKEGMNAAAWDFGLNIPLLLASESIVFPNLFQGYASASTNFLKGITKRTVNEAGETILSEIKPKGFNKILNQFILPNIPKVLVEGGQEMAQQGLQTGTEKYFNVVNDDHSLSTMNALGQAIQSGLNDPEKGMFSSNGWNQGFQGALLGIFGEHILHYGSGKKFGSPGQGQRNIDATRSIMGVNSLTQSGNVSDMIRAYNTIQNGNTAMNTGLQENDQVKYQSGKSLSFFGHVQSRINKGMFDAVHDDLNDLRNIDKEKLQQESNGVLTSSSIDDIIEHYTKEADKIKAVHDAVERLLPDQIKTSEDGKSNYSTRPFKESLKMFSYLEKDALNRSKEIKDKVLKNLGLGNTSLRTNSTLDTILNAIGVGIDPNIGKTKKVDSELKKELKKELTSIGQEINSKAITDLNPEALTHEAIFEQLQKPNTEGLEKILTEHTELSPLDVKSTAKDIHDMFRLNLLGYHYRETFRELFNKGNTKFNADYVSLLNASIEKAKKTITQWDERKQQIGEISHQWLNPQLYTTKETNPDTGQEEEVSDITERFSKVLHYNLPDGNTIPITVRTTSNGNLVITTTPENSTTLRQLKLTPAKLIDEGYLSPEKLKSAQTSQEYGQQLVDSQRNEQNKADIGNNLKQLLAAHELLPDMRGESQQKQLQELLNQSRDANLSKFKGLLEQLKKLTTPDKTKRSYKTKKVQDEIQSIIQQLSAEIESTKNIPAEEFEELKNLVQQGLLFEPSLEQILDAQYLTNNFYDTEQEKLPEVSDSEIIKDENISQPELEKNSPKRSIENLLSGTTSNSGITRENPNSTPKQKEDALKWNSKVDSMTDVDVAQHKLLLVSEASIPNILKKNPTLVQHEADIRKIFDELRKHKSGKGEDLAKSAVLTLLMHDNQLSIDSEKSTSGENIIHYSYTNREQELVKVYDESYVAEDENGRPITINANIKRLEFKDGQDKFVHFRGSIEDTIIVYKPALARMQEVKNATVNNAEPIPFEKPQSGVRIKSGLRNLDDNESNLTVSISGLADNRNNAVLSTSETGIRAGLPVFRLPTNHWVPLFSRKLSNDEANNTFNLIQEIIKRSGTETDFKIAQDKLTVNIKGKDVNLMQQLSSMLNLFYSKAGNKSTFYFNYRQSFIQIGDTKIPFSALSNQREYITKTLSNFNYIVNQRYLKQNDVPYHYLTVDDKGKITVQDNHSYKNYQQFLTNHRDNGQSILRTNIPVHGQLQYDNSYLVMNRISSGVQQVISQKLKEIAETPVVKTEAKKEVKKPNGQLHYDPRKLKQSVQYKEKPYIFSGFTNFGKGDQLSLEDSNGIKIPITQQEYDTLAWVSTSVQKSTPKVSTPVITKSVQNTEVQKGDTVVVDGRNVVITSIENLGGITAYITSSGDMLQRDDFSIPQNPVIVTEVKLDPGEVLSDPEESPKEDKSSPEGTSSTPVDRSKLANGTNKPIINTREVNNIKRMLPKVANILSNLEEIRDKYGKKLYGQFLANGKILLSTYAVQGTAYHEAFHYVYELLFNDAERNQIQKEFSRIQPGVDHIEGLPNIFEKYQEGTKTPSGIINRFFHFLNQILEGLGFKYRIGVLYNNSFSTGSDYIDKVFKDIDEGRFKTRTPIYDRGQSRSKEIEDTTPWGVLGEMNQKKLMQGLSAVFISKLNAAKDIGNINLKSIDAFKKDAGKIFLDSVAKIKEKQLVHGKNSDVVQKILNVLDKDNIDSFTDKFINNLKANGLNIGLNTEGENDGVFDEVTVQNQLQDDFDYVKHTPPAIQLLIKGTIMTERVPINDVFVNRWVTDEDTGLVKPVDYKGTINYLYKGLSNLVGDTAIITKLVKLAEYHPELNDILYNIFKTDNPNQILENGKVKTQNINQNLLNEFIATFTKALRYQNTTIDSAGDIVSSSTWHAKYVAGFKDNLLQAFGKKNNSTDIPVSVRTVDYDTKNHGDLTPDGLLPNGTRPNGIYFANRYLQEIAGFSINIPSHLYSIGSIGKDDAVSFTNFVQRIETAIKKGIDKKEFVNHTMDEVLSDLAGDTKKFVDWYSEITSDKLSITSTNADGKPVSDIKNFSSIDMNLLKPIKEQSGFERNSKIRTEKILVKIIENAGLNLFNTTAGTRDMSRVERIINMISNLFNNTYAGICPADATTELNLLTSSSLVGRFSREQGKDSVLQEGIEYLRKYYLKGEILHLNNIYNTSSTKNIVGLGGKSLFELAADISTITSLIPQNKANEELLDKIKTLVQSNISHDELNSEISLLLEDSQGSTKALIDTNLRNYFNALFENTKTALSDIGIISSKNIFGISKENIISVLSNKAGTDAADIHDKLRDQLNHSTGDVSKYDLKTKDGEKLSLIDRFVAYVAVSSTIGLIEHSKIANIHALSFKNINDLFKRTKLFQTGKTIPNTSPAILANINSDFNTKLGIPKTGNTARIQCFSDVLQKINIPGAENLDKYYEKNNLSDGSTNLSYPSQRAWFIMNNMWDDEKESTYQKVMTAYKSNKLEDLILNVNEGNTHDTKPLLAGSLLTDGTLQDGNGSIPINSNLILKTASFGFNPNSSWVTVENGKKTYSDEYHIFKYMLDNNLDGITFDNKAGKVSQSGKISTLYKDGKLNIKEGKNTKLKVMKANWSDFGQVLELPQHDDNLVTPGVQLTRIILSNLFDNGILKNKDPEHALEVHELLKTQGALVNLRLDKIKGLFGIKWNGTSYVVTDFTELQRSIENLAGITGDTSGLLAEALKIIIQNKSSDESFAKQRIENLFNKTLFTQGIRGKNHGIMSVQRPGYAMGKTKTLGITDEVQTALKKIRWNPPAFYSYNEGTKTINAAECYVPYYFRDRLGLPDNINDYEIDPELLKSIGYRIPTQEMASVEKFVLKFLPKDFSVQGSCIVPNGITTKSGSDFDIDKLTLLLPNYVMDRKNKTLKKIQYLEDTLENQEVLFNRWFNTNYGSKDTGIDKENPYQNIQDITKIGNEVREVKNILKTVGEDTSELARALNYLDEYDALNAYQKNGYEASENHLYDLMYNLMNGKDMLDQMLTPIDQSALPLKKLAESFKSAESENNLMSVFNWSTNIIKRQSYMNAQNLRGLAVIHNNLHPLLQSVNFTMKNVGADNSKLFGFKDLQNDNISLGRVNMINSINKITNLFSGIISGTVDVTKEDFLFALGFTNDTANVACLLGHTGLDEKQIFTFLTQPFIRKALYGKALKNTKRELLHQYTNDYAEFDKAWKVGSSWSALKAESKEKYSDWTYGLKELEELKDFFATKFDSTTNTELKKDYVLKQFKILDDYNRLNDVGRQLDRISNTTRFDNDMGKTQLDLDANLTDVYSLLHQGIIPDSAHQFFDIQQIQNLLNIPYYKNVISNMQEFQDYLVPLSVMYNNPKIRNAVQSITDYHTERLQGDSSTAEYATKKHTNQFMNAFLWDSLGKKYEELVQKKGIFNTLSALRIKYPNNLFLQYLENKADKHLEYKLPFFDRQDEDSLRYGYDTLRRTEPEFIQNLAVIHTFQAGYNNNIQSLGQILNPHDVYDFIKPLLSTAVQNLDDTKLMQYFYQSLLSLGRSPDVVKNVYLKPEKQTQLITRKPHPVTNRHEGDIIASRISTKDKNIRRSSKNYTVFYKLDGYDSSTKLYNYVQIGQNIDNVFTPFIMDKNDMAYVQQSTEGGLDYIPDEKYKIELNSDFDYTKKPFPDDYHSENRVQDKLNDMKDAISDTPEVQQPLSKKVQMLWNEWSNRLKAKNPNFTIDQLNHIFTTLGKKNTLEYLNKCY